MVRKLKILSIAVGLQAIVLGAPAIAGDAAHPTVVELFQSQGCSSCPPAIANINALAGRRDILPLTFAVTYWDALGWKDTFARPEFTSRQWDYAHASQRSNVATPQTIVNGRAVTNGGDRGSLIRTIRAADRGLTGPSITLRNGKVEIRGNGNGRNSTVWIVGYDPRAIAVPIRAGENGGRTLVHRNVVKSLKAAATWRGASLVLPADVAGRSGLRYAVLVQQGKGGPIIAASRI